MRIVERAEFLALPSGTFYRAGEPWAFGDLHVKFDSLGTDDWVCMDFANPESNGSDQLFSRFEEMAEVGTSYPLDLDNAGRDGLFSKDEIYLVYERADMERLRDFITETLSALSRDPT